MKFKYQPKLLLAMLVAGLLLSLPQPARATTYCINGTWAGENLTFNIDSTTHTYRSADQCIYGCDSKLNQCNPAPWVQYTGIFNNIGLLGMIILISVIFIVLAKVR